MLKAYYDNNPENIMIISSSQSENDVNENYDCKVAHNICHVKRSNSEELENLDVTLNYLPLDEKDELIELFLKIFMYFS